MISPPIVKTSLLPKLHSFNSQVTFLPTTSFLDGIEDVLASELCRGPCQADQDQVWYILLWVHKCFLWSKSILYQPMAGGPIPQHFHPDTKSNVTLCSSLIQCDWQSSTIPTYAKLNAFMESTKPSVMTKSNSEGLDRVIMMMILFVFRDLWPLRHLIRVMKRHDLTEIVKKLKMMRWPDLTKKTFAMLWHMRH